MNSTAFNNGHAQPGVDLGLLKSELAARAATIAPLLLPQGRREGHHWVTGDIGGAPGRSFKVCLSGDKAGLCKDFASGEKGGTLIDVCMAVRGCDFNAAVAHCGELVGLHAPAPLAWRGAAHALESVAPRPAFDWQSCRAAVTDDLLEDFAEWRSFAFRYCARLRDEGLLGSHEGAVALPVVDLHGVCIGVQYFPSGSRGFYTKGTTAHPFVIGALPAAQRVFGFESPWDALAYYELCGLAEGEAIISTRGVDHAPKLAGRVPESAEFIVFRQNDAPDARGRIADEDWFSRILETLERPVKSVRVPERLKDLNDWTREGVTAAEVQAAIEHAPTCGESHGTPLADLAKTVPDPQKTVLGDRYLCTGGGLLFVGPSGIGKSSASVQQDILWSLGREAFGIRPARPLRILTVQAENDDGDLGEMARGVAVGLELSQEEWNATRDRVIYVTENRRSGVNFLARLRQLLVRWRPDLLRIDPFLAYLEGDNIKTEVTAAFLRQGLNPLLSEFECAVILCHHTPKATRDTSAWRGSDWMYAGAGSADITNWARAILVIDPTHAPSVFRFVAPKRTRRTGWLDADGRPELVRYFCHAGDGSICWRPATPEDIESADQAATDARRAASGKATATVKTKADLLALVPAIGSISKNALISKANNAGMGLNRTRGLLAELLDEEDLYILKKGRSGTRPDLHVTRHEPRSSDEIE